MGVSISIEGIRLAENIRKEWIRTVYNDMEDPYSLDWQGKLGMVNLQEGHILSNEAMTRELEEYGDWAWGDIIAFDVSPDAESQSLVYLSHDGSDIHGDIVAVDLHSYLVNSLALGCAGAGEAALDLFMEPGKSLQSDTQNGRAFRKWIGWNEG